ncbi:hypothetical protein [Phyllobacterium leguminum]|uniref:Uncharacterized protein n=1 Tax=Phyllobacterium leguminum TaxID=314237 RepID=A0A318T2Q8_9HYPH|nr:hypothetical protein [Phyllobacterium leguminum]PYE88188.1 hypothetical protein C7477_10859 [Phyllobacterium leguminum]
MAISLNSLGSVQFTNTAVTVAANDAAQKFYVLITQPPGVIGSEVVPVSYKNGQATAEPSSGLYKTNLNIAYDPQRQRLYGAPNNHEISGYGIKVYGDGEAFNIVDVIGYGGPVNLDIQNNFTVPEMAVFDNLLVTGFSFGEISGLIWVYNLDTKQSNYYPVRIYAKKLATKFCYYNGTIFFAMAIPPILYWIENDSNSIKEVGAGGLALGAAMDKDHARLYLPVGDIGNDRGVAIFSIATLPPTPFGSPIMLDAPLSAGEGTAIDNSSGLQYISVPDGSEFIVIDTNSNQQIFPQMPPVQPSASSLSIIEQDHVICALYQGDNSVTLYQQTGSL